MKKGTYAILNKEYSKEEYDALRGRIVEKLNNLRLKAKGWGESH